ncbi:hypothetical protein [Nocardioides zeae]
MLLAVVALLAGMALTIVGAALRGGDEPREAPTADATGTAGGGVPTATTTPPAPDLEPRPNPDLAVLFTDIDAVGLDIEMAWTDPSEGEAEFYVAQTSGPDGAVVDYKAVLAPGTRQYVLPGALAAGGRQCYAILLRMPTGSSASPTSAASPRRPRRTRPLRDDGREQSVFLCIFSAFLRLHRSGTRLSRRVNRRLDDHARPP